MTRKRFYLIGIFIAVIGCALLASITLLRGRDVANRKSLAYIERTTGMVFPSGVSEVDVYDNLEFYVVAHARLPEKDTRLFINQHGFEPKPGAAMPWTESLRPENRAIPADADLWSLEGQSQTNRWVAVIEQNSGRLWMVIFYPDPGGTAP